MVSATQLMSDRQELLKRGQSRRALRLLREVDHRAGLDRTLRQAQRLRGPSMPPAPPRDLIRVLSLFLASPYPAQKAQVKGRVRRWMLWIGATDAAASGVPWLRRVRLLVSHLVAGGKATASIDSSSALPIPPTIERAIAPGVPWHGPLFSVVIDARLAGSPEGEETLAQVARQTLGRLETVVWSQETRQAWHPASVTEPWIVEENAELCSTLLGKYAWIATATARGIPPPFLELNAMALEGEQLEFAINAFGLPEAGELAIRRGRIPGTAADQAVLVTGDASRLRDDLSWSIPENKTGEEARLERCGEAVTGRLLTHRLAAPVAEPSHWIGELQNDSKARPHDVARRSCISGPLIVSTSSREGGKHVTHVLRRLDTDVPVGDLERSRNHVLALFPYLAVGGAETQTLEMMKRLSPRYSFTVATTEPLAGSLGSMVAEYLDVTPNVLCLPEAVDRELFASAVSGIIARRRIGTVFVANGSNWIYDTAASIKARFPGLRLVNQVFDHRIGWIQRYDFELIDAFDHHVAPNARIAEAYRQRGVDPSKISLVYHGIDTARYAPDAVHHDEIDDMRRAWQLPPGRPVVVMVGRLHPQKRPLDFLALAHRMPPDAATFLLVGDGPLVDDIDVQIARMALPHVRRLPFQRPVEKILVLADVVMILSEYEGLPLVLLEAQSLGTPVIGTDVGAIREALDWTGGGTVVPVGDISAAERALVRILSSPPTMSGVRDRLRARFDIDVTARGYAAAFEP